MAFSEYMNFTYIRKKCQNEWFKTVQKIKICTVKVWRYFKLLAFFAKKVFLPKKLEIKGEKYFILLNFYFLKAIGN